MKLKNLVLTSAALLIGSSLPATAAKQHVSKPTPAVIEQEVHLHHGKEERQNDRAPQAESNYQPTKKFGKSAKLAIACNVNAFATSNSTTLINQIKSQGATCVNDLFNASSSTQVAAFSSDNMYAVANHAKSLSTSYAGGGSADLEALFLFLRAGYYVEFYNNSVSFISWVKPAVKGAIDAFVNNVHFYDDNDAHGKTLGEVITTMDSSEQQDVYLPVVKEWLNRWNQSYASKWNMRNAVNGIFTILFRGQWNTNFVSLVGTDTTLVSRLRSFALSAWMVDSDSEFMVANAGRELGRLKTYSGTAIQPSVDSAINAIFSTYQMYGYGDAVWLGTADTASYYGNCADYNICNYGAQIKSQALSQSYTCSSSIKILSQNLTNAQQVSACNTMGLEETFFHSQLQTNYTPIANDVNVQLQVNIFDSSNDYGKYAAAIFGIDTNNGGMYLEGNPSQAGNIPNFIAYEASYAEPDHYVWNLEHEYVHYLDGRFNLYGGFGDPTEEVVWWAEGVAEYISQENNNQAAIDTIADGSTYSLATIFATNYDGFDQDRIYRWGYLAVRFMFERHLDEVKLMLASTRTGNWAAYKSRINTWANSYEAEFVQWGQDLVNGGGSNNVAPTAAANGPYSGNTNVNISFSSNGSTDSDGSITSYLWNFGDGTTSTQASPSHSYTTANTYTVTLTVTDNQGASDTTTTTATISQIPTGSVLTNGTPLQITGAQGSENRYTMTVPANANNLNFAINGGTGDADIYVKFGSAPTKTSYDCRPWLNGNNESCPISNTQAGTYHVLIVGYNSYSTTLTGSYTGQAGYNVPNACANENPQYSGSLTNGNVACLGTQNPIWLSIGDVNGHSSVAITTANGTGNINLDFSTGGWPNSSNVLKSSNNSGNGECIYVTNLSQYWGYLKVSGTATGASIVVDFDTPGCR